MPVADHTAEELGSALIRLVKLVTGMRQYAPAPHPQVDHTHYPVLFVVARSPQRVSDLATMIMSDVSTVSRQVSHLERHGMVVKVADPTDGRAQVVTLTDEGRAAIRRITAARGAWMAQLLADWDTEQAHDFLQHLTRFATSIERAKAQLDGQPRPGATA